tara:strand:+ start:4897 stop:6003 length:1107 start_codon:yes stop_codon:yes gene_type:complete
MKIGITLDMSVAFWANGMQQNIVFLYEMIERCGHECFYITHKKPIHTLKKNHKGMLLDDLLADDNENLDLLIVAGFDLFPEMYDKLKSRNSNFKTILIHFGNKLMDDINHSLLSKSPKLPLEKPKHLEQIWISPQHEYSQSYIKTYYNFKDVIIIPFIWDSFFIEDKIKELKKKGMDPSFKKEQIKKVCVFEPNISFIKNCVIPINICENLYHKDPKILNSINIFCCQRIKFNPFFEKLMNRLEVVKKKDFCYFNKRWSLLDALSKFGSTIVSHQIKNELNYSYLEALFLNLPLIHNSSTLEDVGYYYPDCDVDFGANQLKNAILNHSKTLDQTKYDNKNFLKQYSPYNQDNINIYNKIINDIKNKQS